MSLFQRLHSIKNRTPDQTAELKPPSPVLLPEGQEISSKFGKCVMLEESTPGTFHFPEYDPADLLLNLKLIKGIGPVTEAKLREQGIANVSDLLEHPRWGGHAHYIKDLVEQRRVKELQSMGAKDRELLSYFDPEDILFLDIETTGLWASQPLFLVGLLYHREGKLLVNQYFARHYREEKAVLAAANDLIQDFKVVVSFNGKRFDIPYISGRSVEHRLFYSYPHHQVDLLYHARRQYCDILPNCKLTTLEEHILDFQRQDDIPGYLIPETYHRFTQKQDASLIQPVLEHNRLDLLAMVKLFKLIIYNVVHRTQRQRR